MRVIASDAGKVVLLESFVVVAEWEAPGATPAAITSDKPRPTAGDRGPCLFPPADTRTAPTPQAPIHQILLARFAARRSSITFPCLVGEKHY